jgi:hypothetical protein
VEANTTLGRTTRVIVLDAESAENSGCAIIHPNRDRELEFAGRPAEQIASSLIHAEKISGMIKLRLRHGEWIERFAFHYHFLLRM